MSQRWLGHIRRAGYAGAVSRLVWVPCFVCAACGSAGGLEDAGFDAEGRDAATDAPRSDAPPPPPWEHPWDVALGALTVHSTECADWEDVTRPPELAEDPTPRELWRMSFGALL